MGVKLLIGMQYEFIYAAMLINRILCGALAQAKVSHTLMQKQKQAFNESVKAAERCYKQMEVAFDDTFLEAMMQNEAYVENTNAIQGDANRLARMAILYYTRKERGNVLKAMANFKPDPNFDVEGLLDLFPLDQQ